MVSFHLVVTFFAFAGVLLLAVSLILFIPSGKRAAKMKDAGDEPGQQKKLSRLCLAGFILSALYLILLAIDYYFVETKTYLLIYSSIKKWTDTVLFLVIAAGIILSITGLISARKYGRSGRKFGIAGLVLPAGYATIVVIMLITVIVNALVQNGRTVSIQEKREVKDMGRVGNPVNTMYDVSPYQIPEGYDFDDLNVTTSEADLKAYAEDKLQTTVFVKEMSAKGKFQGSDFLIVRSDLFDEWLTENNLSGFGYQNGYAALSYDYSWEFGGIAYNTLAVYKDPSDGFIIITNCSDHLVICEFFEGIGEAVPTEEPTYETMPPEFYENNEQVVYLKNNTNVDMALPEIVDVFEKMCEDYPDMDVLWFCAHLAYDGHSDELTGEYIIDGDYYCFNLERWITIDEEVYVIDLYVYYEPDTTFNNIHTNRVSKSDIDGDFFDYVRNTKAYEYASTQQIVKIDIEMWPF